MIDAEGKRVATPQDDAIPPHMLVGRPSSSVQAAADAGELGQDVGRVVTGSQERTTAPIGPGVQLGEASIAPPVAERRRRS
jgi:hypothetical protein